MDAFDRLDTNTGEVAPKFSRNQGKGDAFDRMPGPNNEFEKFFTNMFEGSEGVVEGTAKVLNKIPGARTALQVPLGIAQGTGYGIVTGLLDMIGTGEALSPDTIHDLRIAHERAGKPFDEEEYINAVHKVASEFPTPGNIARMVEEKTDLPLTPQSRLDKFINFASTAGKMAPAGATLRPFNVGLPKPVLGAGVATGKEVLDEMDLLPEPVNELLSFLLLKQPTSGQSLSFGKKTKPSGMIERGFEGIQEPREVTAGKHAKITEKLESDFKEVANKIIEESPIGETARALVEDPLIKRKAEELMNRATEVASKQKNPIATVDLKKEMANNVSKNVKGYALSEYEKSYMKYMKEAIDEILPDKISAVELVEQYRKNNKSLAEAFEPGSSKAINNAKRDALLDHNRAIAQVMEKTNPELAEVFKEGNANWSNIKNAEAIDDFISTVFKEGKIDFREMKDAFNDKNYQRIFKNALGEKGAAEFEQLMTDMLGSEKSYKMLKVAQGKGFWKDLAQTSVLSYLSPKAAIGKFALQGGKQGFKFLMNSLLDKPKLTIKLNQAVQDLKKGNFAAAEKGFKEVDAELLPKEPGKGSAKAPGARGETIEVKGERVEPKGEAKAEPAPAPAKAEAPKQLEAPKKQIEQKLNPRQERIKEFNKEFNERKESGPVIEIEYKPREIPKTVSTTSEAKPSKLPETRGKGEIFHGSPNEIKNASREHYSSLNYYGQGFYTTDAIDIASGYASRKGKAKNPTIYKITEKRPVKLFDMEQPIPRELKAEIEKLDYHEAIAENLSENPKQTLRELYDGMRESGLSADEIQEEFDTIARKFEKAGYEGFRHEGGNLTGKTAHDVKIYFNPEETINLEKVSDPANYKIAEKSKEAPAAAKEVAKAKATKAKSPAQKAKEKAAEKGKPVDEVIAEMDKKYPESKKAPEKTEPVAEIKNENNNRITEVKEQIHDLEYLLHNKEIAYKNYWKKGIEHAPKKRVNPKMQAMIDEIRDLELQIRLKYEQLQKRVAKEETKQSLPQEKVNIVKRQDITPKGLKAQKAWLVEQLDEAIAKAPEGYEEFKSKWDFGEYSKDARKAKAAEYDLLTFEIPGDGTMKIRNHKKALEAFKASVEKRWPEKAASAPQKKNTSVPKLTKEELDSMRVR